MNQKSNTQYEPLSWFRSSGLAVKQSSEADDWTRISAQSVVHERDVFKTPELVDHTIAVFLTPNVKIAKIQDGTRFDSYSSTGLILVAPALQPATWEIGGTMDMFHLFISPRLIKDSVKSLPGLSENTLEILPRFAKADSRIEQLALMIKHELDEPTEGSQLFADSIATALAIHLARYHSNKSIKAKVDRSPSHRKLIRLKDYIEENYNRDLRLRELTNIAGFDSSSSFLRTFKKEFGITPHQYLVQTRIAHAKTLLGSRLYSIGETALIVGFCNQAHFTSAFKMHIGLTPGQYQKGL